jgi:diguanylate cyclase (GGDEF)-like protein
MLGVLLVAPGLWWMQRRVRQHDAEPLQEGPVPGAALALVLLLAVATAIYSGWLERTVGLRHTTLLVLPPAVWLALRYPLPYTLLGNLAAVLIADIGTSMGHGPFSDHTSGLPLLHLVFVGTTLLMAASRTERTLATAQVHRLATRDTLTDLPNRNLLALRLEAALATAQRYQQRVGVLFIDLDHFKRINDSLGHAVGDQLLVAATQRITAVLRSDSTVARVGGDEFVAVMERLKDAEDTSRAAARIIAALEHPFEIGQHQLTISCSVGVASFPEDGRNGSELIKHADIAMYEAKNAGRNQFRYFSPAMNEEVRRRLEIENGLRRALQSESFVLHWQPVFDAIDGRLQCVEALLRWQRPDGTLVGPNEFIRIAEETGLIEGIGAWVLNQAAAQTKAWREAGLRTVPVCVNLSVRQLRNAGALADQVQNALRDHDLDGRDLVLEITESMLLKLGGEAEDSLQRLAHHGITLALDDFGTGYSSLGYLARLPIDTLKIDRSFVHAMMERDPDRKLVRVMIELAHALDMRVTAEGVETSEQQALLRSMRADAIQGNLMCPALPAALFAERHLQNIRDA